MVNKFGGRKFALMIATLGLFMWFGVYCVAHGIELSDAGVYIGVVGATVLGYAGLNVYQKNGNGKGK